MRKMTVFLFLSLLINTAGSQTFQSSNALIQKGKPGRSIDLSAIDPLPTLNFSIPGDSVFNLQLGNTQQYLFDVQKDILSVWSSVNGIKDIKQATRLKYNNIFSEMVNKINGIKSLQDTLSKIQDSVASKTLEENLDLMRKELFTKQLTVEKLNLENENQLKQNADIIAQVKSLKESLTNALIKHGKSEAQSNKYIKTIYKLRIKLNEPDLEGIFRSYKEVYRKFISIRESLDTVSWFTEKSLNSEDGVAIKNAYKKLNRMFAKLEILKSEEETDSTQFSKILSEYRKIDILFGNPSLDVSKIFDQLDDKLDAQYKTAAISFRKLKSELDNYALEYTKAIDDINPRLKKYEKKESKDQYYSVFGGFKKILEEEGAFIPEINVFAQKKFGEEMFGGYGQLRLFTGAGIGNGIFNTKLNYFVPEASSYGAVLDLGLGFSTNSSDGKPSKNALKRMKDIGINSSLYLMGKNLKASDSLSIKPNIAQWKIGLELLPFQNFFSLRANINGIFNASKVTEMTKYFQQSSKSYWYTDVAFSA